MQHLRESKALIFSFVLMILFSCERTFDTKEELIEYINDENNGLSKSKKVGDYELKVAFKPKDLLIIQELDDEKENIDSIYNYLENKYSKNYYFTLSISSSNGEVLSNVRNMSEFGNMVQTLAFKMDDYVEIVNERKDTIPVLDFIYPRMYGISRSTDILFVFDKEGIEKEEKIIFILKDFGIGIGLNKFEFLPKNFEDYPRLKIKRD